MDREPRASDLISAARRAVQCSGKEPFVSGALAWRVLRREPLRFKRKSRCARVVYRCPVCRKFHIGTRGKED